MRINKYLSECGICSRRGADRLVESGRVTVNGEKAAVGSQVNDGDEVLLDGEPVLPGETKTYLMFNKPRGIVCTSEKREKNNIIDYLNYPARITYAGRLDKDTEGLMILTDDGDLIDGIMRARNRHEKEYVVSTVLPVRDDQLRKMAGGIYLKELNVTTGKCVTKKTGSREFHITITQGLNRQIRRMCDAVGIKIDSLKRIRISGLRLGDLPTGKYREIGIKDINALKSLITKETGTDG